MGFKRLNKNGSVGRFERECWTLSALQRLSRTFLERETTTYGWSNLGQILVKLAVTFNKIGIKA